MSRVILLLALLMGCATPDNAPAGFKAYCERHPERQECGGKK